MCCDACREEPFGALFYKRSFEMAAASMKLADRRTEAKVEGYGEWFGFEVIDGSMHFMALGKHIDFGMLASHFVWASGVT